MEGSLYRPLGLDLSGKRAPRQRPRVLATRLLMGLSAAGLTAAVLLGQPTLRAPEPAPAPATPAAVAAAPAPATGPVAAPTMRMRGSTDLAAVAPPPADTAYATITVDDPGTLRQPPAMAHVPDDALVEESEYGPLPRRAADGRRPLDVYAAAPGASLGTRVAIVVGGLGLSQTGTQAAIRDLPKGVTLAFAPAGNSLGRWMQEARRDGRELMMQAPMEPFGYPAITPGDETLTAEAARGGEFSALYAALARTSNYVGVVNYMGAALTADREALAALLGETDRRGLLFLDDGTSPRSAIRDVGNETRAPFAVTDVVLDRSTEPAEIRRQLDLLERIARSQGSAIATASAFDTSVAAIRAWAKDAEARGIEIVPVSQLAVDPERG